MQTALPKSDRILCVLECKTQVQTDLVRTYAQGHNSSDSADKDGLRSTRADPWQYVPA